jgi:hypothetical protein
MSGVADRPKPLRRSLVFATEQLEPLVDLSRRAEAAGLDRVWTTEYVNRDSIARALTVALGTETIEVAPGDPEVGSLHRRLIPLLGFVIGELLDFERLAPLCGADSRWDFMFVAMPLNLPGGVGSPANAMAIR